MPVVIEELTTTLEIQDEVKIRKLVRDELRRALREERAGVGRGLDGAAGAIDPADATGGGLASEG